MRKISYFNMLGVLFLSLLMCADLVSTVPLLSPSCIREESLAHETGVCYVKETYTVYYLYTYPVDECISFHIAPWQCRPRTEVRSRVAFRNRAVCCEGFVRDPECPEFCISELEMFTCPPNQVIYNTTAEGTSYTFTQPEEWGSASFRYSSNNTEATISVSKTTITVNNLKLGSITSITATSPIPNDRSSCLFVLRVEKADVVIRLTDDQKDALQRNINNLKQDMIDTGISDINAYLIKSKEYQTEFIIPTDQQKQHIHESCYEASAIQAAHFNRKRRSSKTCPGRRNGVTHLVGFTGGNYLGQVLNDYTPWVFNEECKQTTPAGISPGNGGITCTCEQTSDTTSALVFVIDLDSTSQGNAAAVWKDVTIFSCSTMYN